MKPLAFLLFALSPCFAFTQIVEENILGEWVLHQEISSEKELTGAPSNQTVDFTASGKADYSFSGSKFSFKWILSDSVLSVGKSKYRVGFSNENTLILESLTGKEIGKFQAYVRKGTEKDNEYIEAFYLHLRGPEPAVEQPDEPHAPEPVEKEYLTVAEDENDPEDRIYKVVEQNPHFPGCEDIEDKAKKMKCAEEKMLKFVYGNIKYPTDARANKVQGMVVTSFVVEIDGTVSNAKILRDVGYGCGEEALRVVASMPTWEPGTQRGKPVRVQYNLPIRFKLD